MPRAGILIDFMSTHIDFLLILRLGEKCAGYFKLPDTRMPDKRDFTVLVLWVETMAMEFKPAMTIVRAVIVEILQLQY